MLDHTLPLPVPSELPTQRQRASKDLAAVIAVTVLAFLLSSAFELREWLTEATHSLEAYQIDELPLTFAALALSLAWFSWRRWRQSEEELRLRVAAQKALTESLEENRRLSQKYMQVQEDERRSLARELHDEMGQCLNAIKLDAVAIRNHGKQLSADVLERAQAIIDVSGRVYDVARGLMERLRPVALDELGLTDAMRHLIDQWQRRNPEVACAFDAPDVVDGLGEQTNITLYRMVQECLTNVTRHARASAVRVCLMRSASRAEFVLSVSDDGRGLEPGTKRGGLGLVGLRERVEALGGRLEMLSVTPHGLEVRARIQLQPPVVSSGT